MIIRPDLLAAKIETRWLEKTHAENTAHTPALVNELLWFLQSQSTQPGGLRALVNTLIELYPSSFASEAMARIGVPQSGRYTPAQCLDVWKAELLRIDCWTRIAHKPLGSADDPIEKQDFEGWLMSTIDERATVEKALSGHSYNKKMFQDGLTRFNWEFFKTEYMRRAKELLPDYLRELCTNRETVLAGPADCPDLVNILLKYVAHYASERVKTIAQTENSRIVFRELEFAISQNVPVPIIGDSRIGKSIPASAWCAMRPGRARLVAVPESNRMRDFIEAHATALGIDFTPTTRTSTLTGLVKYVHAHSGLFICYDESQFLVPISYHKTTPPARLNFVRCQVIDRGLGCAFIATPQSYRQTLDQYVKTTGYRIEQWLGRLAPAVVLPVDLGAGDMLAIARLHFPGLPDPYLKRIAARAMLTEGYIKNMEHTAKRALFFAQERGHAGNPNREDIDDAIAWLMGEEPPPAMEQAAAPVIRRQSGPSAATKPDQRPFSSGNPRGRNAAVPALETVPG